MPGSARLRENELLKKMTTEQVQQGKLVGAICAAPAIVLQEWGLLDDRKVHMLCMICLWLYRFHKMVKT